LRAAIAFQPIKSLNDFLHFVSCRARRPPRSTAAAKIDSIFNFADEIIDDKRINGLSPRWLGQA
jgi:hypothetical protein